MFSHPPTKALQNLADMASGPAPSAVATMNVVTKAITTSFTLTPQQRTLTSKGNTSAIPYSGQTTAMECLRNARLANPTVLSRHGSAHAHGCAARLTGRWCQRFYAARISGAIRTLTATSRT